VVSDVPDPTLEFDTCADEPTCFDTLACKNQIMYGDYPWLDWE